MASANDVGRAGDLRVRAVPRLEDAAAERDALLARIAAIEAGGRPVLLEIETARPDAPSLQLLAACRRSLEASSLLAGLGPNATAALAGTMPEPAE